MSPGDGLEAEMRRLLRGLRNDPLALDDDSADRLLAGRMDPADAPPGYAGAAAVMAAATAPARPDELDGAESALDAFRAARAGRSIPQRRPRMLVKLLTVKAVAAAFTGALLVGGVAAAATGSLPDAAQRIAHSVVDAAPDPGDKDRGQGIADAARSSQDGSAQGQSAANGQAGSQATGPDLTKIDRTGLCTAYMAGDGGTEGAKYDAAAFQALERAAGGADKVAAWCAAATAPSAGGQGQADQSQAGDAGAGAGTGAGASDDDHGQGQGQDQEHGGGQPQR